MATIDFVVGAAASGAGAGPSAWVEAYGRLHMLVLHFPIALLIVAAGIELVRAAAPRRAGWGGSIAPASAACAVIGGLGGAITASSGWIHADVIGAGDDLTLSLHRWLGVVGASAGFLAALLAVAARLAPGRVIVALTRVALLIGAIGVGAAGHFGGELVHGPGYLLEPLFPRAPVPPAPDADEPAGAGVALRPVDFDAEVMPILEANCWRCHGASRQRGDLRLDSLDWVLTVVEPGEVAGSPLAEVLRLPEVDELHMPKNKPSLPETQIATIERWIAGLVPATGPAPDDLDDLLSGLLGDDEVDGTAPDAEGDEREPLEPREYVAPPESAPWPVLDDAQRATRDEAMSRLREAGLLAQVIADGQDGVEVRVVGDPSPFGDEHVEMLAGLEPSLVVLDLTGSGLTDDGLRAIGRFTRLRRLRVGETGVTDPALPALADLDELESLDLHMTGVGDEGLATLLELERLSTLYLWRTAVTPEAAADVRAERTWLEIDLGR